MLRRIEWNSLESLSSLEPTGVPQTEHRYSYLFPVDSTSKRCLRTGRAARQRGQKSSEASNWSNCGRPLIEPRLEQCASPVKVAVPCRVSSETLS